MITDEVIDFLKQKQFKVILSFDGLAQDIQRKQGSFKKITLVLKKLVSIPEIHLEVNSVFTPETVRLISDSVQYVLDSGVDHLHFSLSVIKPWDRDSLNLLEQEMSQMKSVLRSHYQKKGAIPVLDFRPSKKNGYFTCPAGQDRMAVAPDGKVWGCFLFPEYRSHPKDKHPTEEYCFGDLDSFIKDHKQIYPRVSASYQWLSMDQFQTPQRHCFLCPFVENCGVCPVNMSFSGFPMGEIPEYVCQIHKIRIRTKDEFFREIKT
ncbi:MAG: hypothetical protein GF421_11910 [Candidatus Aminicenantes bacterium]|nr:hypothetical protein [Candidatus Aminicenantes bacterium]